MTFNSEPLSQKWSGRPADTHHCILSHPSMSLFVCVSMLAVKGVPELRQDMFVKSVLDLAVHGLPVPGNCMP